MAIRKIIRIDEDKCTGCGLCVEACAEGAIQIVDGKAKLVSETYCDGLGACIGKCPNDAITIEEREAEPFDRRKAEEHARHMREARDTQSASVCPGTAIRTFGATSSALQNWPVKLRLVPLVAPYLQNADILLVADCVPFALADFHRALLPGKVLLVGCPKLDDTDFHTTKLTEIFRNCSIRSMTVARMEVPCCRGLTRIAELAIRQSDKDISINETIVSIRGEIIRDS